MARALAQVGDITFTSDGTYYITHHVTYVDPTQSFIQSADVVTEVGATDSSIAMQVKVTTDIKQKGADLGLSVTNAEITQPAYIKGLTTYAPARVATTANINLASPGEIIDGVNLIAGNRILVKNQSNPVENGLYIWNSAGDYLVRTADADGAGEISTGAAVVVSSGTVNGNNSQWMVSFTSASPWVPEDSTSIWVRFVFPVLT